MKKAIFFLLAMSFWGLTAQTRFQKTVGTTSNDRNYHLTSMPSGNLLATGYTESVTGNLSDAFLVKYNRFGEVQWAKTYGEQGDETNWDIIVTQNNEVVGVGYTSDVSSNEAGTITRTDSAGNVIWSKGVASMVGNVNFYRVIETSTGHLVTTGLTSSNSQDDIVICKFTSGGNLIWSKIVVTPQDDEMMGVIETSQGHYLLAGLTNDSTGGGSSDFAVVKTDTTGNVIWKKRYGSTGGDRLNDVVEYDNAYYFLGWSPTGGIGNYDAVMMKTDTAGNMDWIYAYGTPQAERAFNMLFDDNHDCFIVAGYTDYSDSTTNNRNTFLMKLDTAGQINWAKSYGSTGTDGHWPTGLATNDDEGYYVLGSTNTFGPGNMSLYLTKTDADGNTACNQKNPQFIRMAMTGWSGAPFGTTSGVSFLSIAITISGMPWTPIPSTQCCSLFNDLLTDQGVCPGDTTLIGWGSIPGYTFNWNYSGTPAGTQPFLQVPYAQTGSYQLTVSAAYSGCIPVTDSILVFQLQAPPKPTISYVSVPGNYLSSSSPDGNQWYYNNMLIPNATQQVYHAFLSGVYHVVVTNQDGCSAQSDTIHHIAIGINEPENNDRLLVYPNPTTGLLNLKINMASAHAKILLYDPDGRLILSKTMQNPGSDTTENISLEHLVPGAYHLKIISDDTILHQPVLLIR